MTLPDNTPEEDPVVLTTFRAIMAYIERELPIDSKEAVVLVFRDKTVTNPKYLVRMALDRPHQTETVFRRLELYNYLEKARPARTGLTRAHMWNPIERPQRSDRWMCLRSTSSKELRIKFYLQASELISTHKHR